MPRINLDELVPEEITFSFRGTDYVIDGDIDIEITFALIDLFHRATEAETDPNITLAVQRDVNLAMRDKLLELFQARDPSIESLPFGTVAFRHVLAEVLQALGLTIVEDPQPPKPEKKTVPRSRRSTTSRRS